MITEFTCGSFRVLWPCSDMQWGLKKGPAIEDKIIAYITPDGELCSPLQLIAEFKLSAADLIEIAVLMNNIKRQYKQLNNG